MWISMEDLPLFLAAAGNELVNADENESGADDWAGQFLLYAGEVIAAIQNDEDIPALPELIAKGTSEKISGAPKIVLRLASGTLTVAQIRAKGKAAATLRYINQVIRALLAGKAVLNAPALAV
jgi:hypothetical protein